MRSKYIYIVALIFLNRNILIAQNIQDSVIKHHQLKEIMIYGDKADNQVRTSFYQSSSLSNTEDILSKIEGVNLIRRGPVGMEPTLRGFSGGQVNVVLDGMKIFGACTDKMDPVTMYVEPVNLKSIEVGQGGNGLSMGSTIGGSLNLKLADATINNVNKFSGSFGSGYYSAAKAVQNMLAVNYSEQRWAVRLGATYRKAGDYRNGANQRTDFSQYEKMNFSLSGKYQINTNSFLKADFILDDGWNIGYPALPMDVGYAKARIGALTYKQFSHNSFISELEAKIYANEIKHSMDDTGRPNVVMHMDMPGKSSTQGAFIDLKSKDLVKHSLNFKADIYHNYVMADMTMYMSGAAPMYMLTWPGNHQTDLGLFLADHIHLNDKNSIDLKMRFNVAKSAISNQMGIDQLAVFGYDVSKSNYQFLKNLSVSYQYQFSEYTSAFANVGYTERMPTTSERYGFYLFNRMDNHDYIGNPLLKNEQALNAELNLLIKNKDFYWKLSGFSNRVHNYIMGVNFTGSSMTIGAEGLRSYINVDYANLSGAESSLNYSFLNNHFTINNTLKWIQGRDEYGKSLPLISPLKTITSLRYVHQKIFLQLENEWSMKQTKINSDFGEKQTDGYSLFNMRSTLTIRNKKSTFDISLGMENIFDIAYHEHLDWGKYLRPGRNIYTMLSVKF
jgi:iron complex outermembrane receptor protein